MEWLTNERLSIPVEPSSVHFIHKPADFYKTMMDRIAGAKRRVVLSSLYLGTGKLERDLVDSLDARLKEKPGLEVSVLLDYFRGTRKDPADSSSSASLLQPLADRASIRLFHSPEMRGAVKYLLPERVNEIIGLQHMKFFIFDDSIIISGANLSDQYFVNRQDRYLLIENCPLLVEFFCAVFEVISSCSLVLDASGGISHAGQAHLHPFTGNSAALRKAVGDQLNALFENFKQRLSQQVASRGDGRGGAADTFVFPFLQMKSFGISQEVDLLSRLFEHEEDDIEVTVSTGYFNLFDEYVELILKRCKYPLTFLFASPQANGFYNATGFAGYVPAMYVHNSITFFNQIAAAQRSDAIKLLEYQRPQWTFHAKGIWIDPSRRSSKRYAATVVGSSNYGYRSVCRDLEAQVLLVTENEALMAKIGEEKKALVKHSSIVDLATFMRKDHFVPRWMRNFSRAFRHFF